MSEITPEDIAAINSFPKLVSLLRDKMEWPLGEDYGFDDVVYEYDPKELGFKPEETAKIREIHQLRPLVTGQPWGIFFVSFEDKKISVTVLRRMLRALVLKKRSTAQAADRQSWQLHDLIFVANFGGSGEREIAFAHFSENEDTGDLPVMKVLGWNAKDTKLHNKYVGEVLRQRLIWPEDHTNVKTWRETWREAFELRQGEAIQTSKGLAIKLAELAIEIRARANELIKLESDSGPMRQMHEAFRKNLIQDLDADGFADMFAQTISYGMLAAKISRPGADLIADNLADMVPRTNPFLKELFGSFLSLGGRDKRKGMDFDELGVNDVVDMLNAAKMDAVLRDFGDKNPKEDPVIHFYELFLKEYDPEKRVQRGVFYTPRPVVNFIVLGVDEVLRTDFDLPLGLADTSTWAELAERNDEITIPSHIDPKTHFVQVLDPATGTGTFIVETIDLIYTRMVEHWTSEGRTEAEIANLWNEYVPNHLLPRLTAFELMMAPYAIAHMKIGLKLSETGYTFSSDERARIFLTNALEPARDLDMEFIFMSEALAHEASAANHAKTNTPYTVVIGNPPYSNFGQMNKSEFVSDMLLEYKKGLNERKLNLDDDYIKFFRFSHLAITKSNWGCIGLITNNSYIDGVTHRQMRKSVVDTFNSICSINLHGSVRRNAELDSSVTDENVFDIQQGVSILIAAKPLGVFPRKNSAAELIGSRTKKFEALLETSIKQFSKTTFKPAAPLYLFVERDFETGSEFYNFELLTNIFGSKSTGVKTHQDSTFVSFSKDKTKANITAFADEPYDLNEVKKRSSKAKKIHLVKSALKNGDYSYESYYYRPFDVRTVFYSKTAIPAGDHRYPVMQHFEIPNLGLASVRQTSQGIFQHGFVFSNVMDMCFLSTATKECAYGYPLWLKPTSGEINPRSNIERGFSSEIANLTKLTFHDGIPHGEQPKLGDEFRRGDQVSMLEGMWDGRGDLESNFGPRDLFDFIYAVLHSPCYRTRYAEFLKSDFPRIPTPATRDLFAELIPLGQELVSLHLVKPDEASVLREPDIRFAGSGEARVEKGYPKYENGKVMINSTRWFEDVPQETWEFQIGGYRVCDKWLKDRAGKGGKNPRPGRVLTDEDILHYRRTVTALTETSRIMAEIDQVIDTHGGWPDAFALGDEVDG